VSAGVMGERVVEQVENVITTGLIGGLRRHLGQREAVPSQLRVADHRLLRQGPRGVLPTPPQAKLRQSALAEVPEGRAKRRHTLGERNGHGDLQDGEGAVSSYGGAGGA